MAAPTIVNQSSNSSVTNTTSVTVTLPTVTNGNLLISWLMGYGPSNSYTVNNGWTIGYTGNDGFTVIAYRLVDGTQGTTLQWSWTGSISATAGIIQISGQNAALFGNFSGLTQSDPGQISTTVVAQTIKSTADNSLMLAFTASNTAMPAAPTGSWTGVNTATNTSFNIRISSETLATAFTAMDAISVSVTGGAHWEAIVLEIPSGAPKAVYPVFGGGWTQVNGSLGSSVTGVLPGIRQNGDLMIAVVSSSTSAITYTWPGGWTPGDNTNSQASASWAWALVTGSETAPVVTSSPNSSSGIFIKAYRNSLKNIGAHSVTQGNSTSISLSGVTTTASDSLIAGLMLAAGGIPGLTANYVMDLASNPTDVDFNFCWEQVQTKGNTSDALSSTVTSGKWAAFLIEISGGLGAFRKTLSQIGSRIGSRQIQGWGN